MTLDSRAVLAAVIGASISLWLIVVGLILVAIIRDGDTIAAVTSTLISLGQTLVYGLLAILGITHMIPAVTGSIAAAARRVPAPDPPIPAEAPDASPH